MAVLREHDRLERRAAFCEDWIVRLGVDAVAFSEDNLSRDSLPWIRAAARRGARSAVVSYGAMTPSEFVMAFRNLESYQVPEALCASFKTHLAKWTADVEGKVITRLPWRQALGAELFGLNAHNPWAINSGNADIIAVESERMKSVYLDHGFPESQVVATGHPLFDRMSELRACRPRLRAELLAKHGMTDDRRLIAVALTPDMTAKRPNMFSSYDDIIAAFVSEPRDRLKANVIVSPHPNAPADVIAKIKALGAGVEQASVAELLPLADGYVGCVSSTIKWALACAMPVVDFDCYGYNYPDYLDLPQVFSPRSPEEYGRALDALAADAVWNEAAEAARADACRWGELDGAAVERIIDLCFGEDSSGD